MNTDNTHILYYDTDKRKNSYKDFIDSDNFSEWEYFYGSIYVPKGGIDLPLKKNYTDGYMLRYFYKQGNNKNAPVREINSAEYKSASKFYLYKTAVLKWKIIGEKTYTSQINKNIVTMTNQILPGISNTLWNPLEYWNDISDTAPISLNVTAKYVTTTQLAQQYTVLSPSQLGTADYEMYLLSQDYIVLLTEDYVGILVEDNT